MDERYQLAVEALRETMTEYDDDSQVISASAAEIFVKELDKDDSFVQGVDLEQATKVLFLLTTAMLLVRDQMAADCDHLLEVAEDDEAVCEDEDCHYSHEEVDSERILAVVDGFELAIAAAVGTTLTVADLAGVKDPNEFDWSGSDGPR